MRNDHELRREYVIDQAIAAGKFGENRRTFWRGEYDRNPAGTEQTLAALASVTEGTPAYPREILFPPTQRRHPPARRSSVAATVTSPTPQPAPVPPAAPASDEQVAGWTRELFPETAAAGARSRVTRAND